MWNQRLERCCARPAPTTADVLFHDLRQWSCLIAFFPIPAEKIDWELGVGRWGVGVRVGVAIGVGVRVQVRVRIWHEVEVKAEVEVVRQVEEGDVDEKDGTCHRRAALRDENDMRMPDERVLDSHRGCLVMCSCVLR